MRSAPPFGVAMTRAARELPGMSSRSACLVGGPVPASISENPHRCRRHHALTGEVRS